MTRAYYNEIEPFAADWLEELARREEITPGRVDRRSIVDVCADDVRDARRAHFFAGIGCWDYALARAGWCSDLVVWTGSCPCQPFSQASPDARGFDDARHLWPVWFKLINECRPAVVFGEQVASPAGLAWLDAVFADLEGAGYACAAADLCAAGVGAPHRRQRLFFIAVADDDDAGRSQLGRGGVPNERDETRGHDAHGRGADGFTGVAQGDAGEDRDRQHARELPSDEGEHALRPARGNHASEHPSAARNPWEPCEWIWCTDGRWRPVEPGTFPLVDGSSFRVGQRAGRLRAYGNAIVPEVAATFIEAACEAAGIALDVDAGRHARY